MFDYQPHPVSRRYSHGAITLIFSAFVFLIAVSASNADPIFLSDPTLVSGGALDFETLHERPKGWDITIAPKSSARATTLGATLVFPGIASLSGPSLYFLKPPDTHIAAGPGVGAAGRIVMVTNGGVGLYDKTGLELDSNYLGRPEDEGIGGNGFFDAAYSCFDPKTIYDQHNDRFYIVGLDGRTSVTSTLHVAVSNGSTPGNLTTDWTKLSAPIFSTIDDEGVWFDYPCIGLDATRFVVAGNMFNDQKSFRGVTIRVFDTAALLAGSASAFTDFTYADGDVSGGGGTFTPQPVHVYGATQNGDFYLINRINSSFYRLWQITGTAAAPVMAAGSPSHHTWEAGAFVESAPQLGTNNLPSATTIDTLSSRLMNAVYRDGALWTVNTVDADGDGASECEWWKIDPNSLDSTTSGVATTPVVLDQGYADGLTTGSWTFMPSVAVNSENDVAIGFSESSDAKYVEMRVAVRDAADRAGFLRPSALLATSIDEYDDFGDNNPERWGDYSAAVVDPENDLDFWVANEVVETEITEYSETLIISTWGTRVARIEGDKISSVGLSAFVLE